MYSPSISPIFTHVDKNIDEHDIDQPLSLTNTLFLEDSSDQTFLSAILEEEPIFADESNNAEPVSLQTTDESIPQNNVNDLPTIVSQTQTEIKDSYEGSDDEESPISIISDAPQFDKISRQLNNIFDDTDDYLSVELKSIIDLSFSNDVLEFKVEYTNGDVQ